MYPSTLLKLSPSPVNINLPAFWTAPSGFVMVRLLTPTESKESTSSIITALWLMVAFSWTLKFVEDILKVPVPSIVLR